MECIWLLKQRPECRQMSSRPAAAGCAHDAVVHSTAEGMLPRTGPHQLLHTSWWLTSKKPFSGSGTTNSLRTSFGLVTCAGRYGYMWWSKFGRQYCPMHSPTCVKVPPPLKHRPYNSLFTGCRPQQPLLPAFVSTYVQAVCTVSRSASSASCSGEGYAAKRRHEPHGYGCAPASWASGWPAPAPGWRPASA